MTRTRWRIAWTIASLLVVETAICGLAMLPVVALWEQVLERTSSDPLWRIALIAAGAAPSYVVFALSLSIVSPIVTRAVGWRTPPDAEMRIADFGWPVLSWVRYMVAIHVVRVLAGTLLRGSPVWTFHLRLAGAKLGRRVYVNSLGLSDYNLLEFGDEVTIGAEAHVAGHTVEDGVVKTARVRLGSNVTIGLCSIIEIGVTVGSNCQVGALSFVPKHTTLPSGAIYAGIPVRLIDRDSGPRPGHGAGDDPRRVALRAD